MEFIYSPKETTAILEVNEKELKELLNLMQQKKENDVVGDDTDLISIDSIDFYSGKSSNLTLKIVYNQKE